MKKRMLLAVILTFCMTLFSAPEFVVGATTTYTSQDTWQATTTGWYRISVEGSSGGNGGSAGQGGMGARAIGKFYFNAGTNLNVYAKAKPGSRYGGDGAYVSFGTTPLIVAGGGGGAGYGYNATSMAGGGTPGIDAPNSPDGTSGAFGGAGGTNGGDGGNRYGAGGKGWVNGCYGGNPGDSYNFPSGGGGGGYSGGGGGGAGNAAQFVGSPYVGGGGGGSFIASTFNNQDVFDKQITGGVNPGGGKVTIEGPIETSSTTTTINTVLTPTSVTVISGKAFTFGIQDETSIAQGTSVTLSTGTVTGTVTASSVNTTDGNTMFTGTLTKTGTASVLKTVTIGGKKLLFKVISPPVTSTSATVTFH